MVVFVAAQGFIRRTVHVRQPVQPAAHQDPVRGRGRDTDPGGEPHRALRSRSRKLTSRFVTAGEVLLGLM